MSKCSNCKHDLEHSSYAFCTQCGTPLLPQSELPTIPTAENPTKQKKSKVQSVEDENKKLRSEIEKLKNTSAVLFGTTQEDAHKRVQRILTVSGYKFNGLGHLEIPFFDRDGDISYNRIDLPGVINNFEFHKKSADRDLDPDEVKYVATYRSAMDLEKELADIRLLLSSCSDRNIACTFVMATNEDLTEHKSLVMNHFREMKTVLPVKKRASYNLELWDQKLLLKLELELKIRVNPKVKTKRKPVQ